ncbi:MAG TPA: AAA family ATPase [Longimicrobiales bacterium]|nr:AAA family ATPase [Longimicrobiales bacterium]
MKVRKLKLHGFKSFADTTEVEFHDGVTAIVGPNGCGKSNISDAIRWVLGEQRPTAIRGSRMDEAIFQGTTERRAVNRAEVALVVSNEDHRFAVPQEEVEIRRTVHREGGSDYELNRKNVRLKDVLDMCRDTGLGANAYAIIEQGMVDSLLSDRADERRQVFEEAAGIGRYKDRRKVALRRLEGAEGDVARLDDLISEVESKVRSLARQRGRAERYATMRDRRLAVEVTAAVLELERLRSSLADADQRLKDLTALEPTARADLSTAETELERRRLENAEVARERSSSASVLDEINRAIAERERDLAVANERRVHSQRRLQQIGTERIEMRERVATLHAEIEALVADLEARRASVAGLAEQVAGAQERQRALREALASAREDEQETRSRQEELAERIAQCKAAAHAARAREADAADRAQRMGLEHEELESELARLEEQGDLFAHRARELSEIHEQGREELEASRARLEALRSEELDARRTLSEAEDRENLLAARVGALEALEREYHGFSPAVAAALEARAELEGLVGPLAELVSLPDERAAALEGSVGALLQALVVADDAAVARVRAWIRKGGREDGVLALLRQGDLATVQGLLERLEFVGEPPSEPVLVGRREKLTRLRRQAEEATRAREARAAARNSLAARVEECEAELRGLEEKTRGFELELRRLDADEASRSGQRARTERNRDELERQRAGLRAAAEQARGEAAAAAKEVAEAESALSSLQGRRQDADVTLTERQGAWEEVRDEVAELRIGHAREEAALAELERRRTSAEASLAHAQARLEALDAEEADHQAAVTELEEAREDGAAELQLLFTRREDAADALRSFDDRLSEAGSALEALEQRVRKLRTVADTSGEERHKLELRLTEAGAARQRIRERLEVEWNRPFEQLVEQVEPVEGELEPLRAELQQLVSDIDRLGPINMLAMEEYDEEKQRLDFLTGQRQDLVQARDDLQKAIREINRTARQLFMDTFTEVRENFRTTFQTLFEGGQCDVWLADEDDPLESPIEISASPRGKRTQRIHLLSGGERALTSLALLFAIYLVKPSPFCVLDEVDAPLDEANIGRFISMLNRFKDQTQFIVVTHNPRTMEAADWIYGVTMEEPGVSSIVGVQLEEDAPRAATA